MKRIKYFLLLLICILELNAKNTTMDISFKDLTIMELVTISSKVIGKNILLTHNIEGTVDFISNEPATQKDILKILKYTLESKGYTLIENDGILRIIRLNESSKYNPPLVKDKTDQIYFQMITEIIPVQNSPVDYLSSKIRHLISKNGKLVTDKTNNLLMVTDFGENIKTIKDVIVEITKKKNTITEVIKLDNINVKKAKTLLTNYSKSIYGSKIEKDKVDILENSENNSITIIGAQNKVKKIIEYLVKIEQESLNSKKVVKVISLKNVDAENIIKILDGIIKDKKYEDADKKPHASMDKESNSIVLIGAANELSYLEMVIEQLDKDKLQVYVQAKIIEVSEVRSKNIGLKYGLSAAKSSGSNIFNLGSNLGGSVNAINPASFSDIFNISAPTLTSGIALGATLNLLKDKEVIDVVSEPSILCINNKESSIYVGETKSFQKGSVSSTSNPEASNISYERENIGLTLKVKPRISNQNKVTLEIETILEDAKELKQNQVNPDTTKKEVKTSAIVMNGESVILGGLIKNKANTITEEVPFFSDIPILGNLFKNNQDVNDKINLVVIVTPYIIPKSKDLTYMRNQLSELKELEEKFSNKLNDHLKEIEEKENSKTLDSQTKRDYQKEHEERMKKMFGI